MYLLAAGLKGFEALTDLRNQCEAGTIALLLKITMEQQGSDRVIARGMFDGIDDFEQVGRRLWASSQTLLNGLLEARRRGAS